MNNGLEWIIWSWWEWAGETGWSYPSALLWGLCIPPCCSIFPSSSTWLETRATPAPPIQSALIFSDSGSFQPTRAARSDSCIKRASTSRVDDSSQVQQAVPSSCFLTDPSSWVMSIGKSMGATSRTPHPPSWGSSGRIFFRWTRALPSPCSISGSTLQVFGIQSGWKAEWYLDCKATLVIWGFCIRWWIPGLLWSDFCLHLSFLVFWVHRCFQGVPILGSFRCRSRTGCDSWWWLTGEMRS